MLALLMAFTTKFDYTQALLYSWQAYKTLVKAGPLGIPGVPKAISMSSMLTRAMLADFRKQKVKAPVSTSVKPKTQ
jgi:hypothetical protein